MSYPIHNYKRYWGQNFLINKEIAEREIKYCMISKKDVVLEIGAGNGILTNFLSMKAKKVIAIEIDEKLYFNLKKSINNRNIIFINNDVLKIDFKKLPKFNKIVSNLPFNISLPITLKILDYDFNKAILIYQKEFADRMVAKQGSKKYSRLSVLIYYKSKCRIIEDVSKINFSPKPKIDCSIVELKPRKIPPFTIKNEKFFYDLTKNLFKYRRKKIQNSLIKNYNFNLKNIPFKNNRIDDLSPKQIGKLSNILSNQIEYK